MTAVRLFTCRSFIVTGPSALVKHLRTCCFLDGLAHISAFQVQHSQLAEYISQADNKMYE